MQREKDKPLSCLHFFVWVVRCPQIVLLRSFVMHILQFGYACMGLVCVLEMRKSMLC